VIETSQIYALPEYFFRIPALCLKCSIYTLNISDSNDSFLDPANVPVIKKTFDKQNEYQVKVLAQLDSDGLLFVKLELGMILGELQFVDVKIALQKAGIGPRRFLAGNIIKNL
jgi:hypothetical protein